MARYDDIDFLLSSMVRYERIDFLLSSMVRYQRIDFLLLMRMMMTMMMMMMKRYQKSSLNFLIFSPQNMLNVNLEHLVPRLAERISTTKKRRILFLLKNASFLYGS